MIKHALDSGEGENFSRGKEKKASKGTGKESNLEMIEVVAARQPRQGL